MGNTIKSRLHRKKEDHAGHAGHTDDHSPKSENTNAGRNQVDQQIMSGPNRARAAEAGGAPDTAHVPPTTRGVDTTQPATTTARART